MKHDILFRGKRCFDGKWIEGYFVKDTYTGQHMIYGPFGSLRMSGWVILPETLGQFTGLTDKNGKRIFEGDIITFRDYTEPCIIMWDQEKARWYMMFSDCMMDFDHTCTPRDFEVIGNVNDNPEPLNAEVEG